MYIKGVYIYDGHKLLDHRRNFKKAGTRLLRVCPITSIDSLARAAAKQYGLKTTLNELLKKPELSKLSEKVEATPAEIEQYAKAEARLTKHVDDTRRSYRRSRANAITSAIKEAARVFARYGIEVPQDLTPKKLPKGLTLEDFPKPASKEKKKA